MKISLEWLSDFLPGPLDADAAADALTRGGLPVEAIDPIGDDTVIDVEVTSNRADCLSHQGIARELAALLNLPLKAAEAKVLVESAEAASSATSVRIEAPDLCPHYTARILRGVRIGPSPNWMKRRLEAVGLRPINNVVDVTNYVLFETGQPLHTFDFDRVEGRRILVRRARPGEKLVTLDGKEVQLSSDMLTIAADAGDAGRPVALAGVMGGKDSEVTDATRNILLESARFDPLSVRKTARALAMRSDSSYRFERGIDPTLPLRASQRAAQLILDLAGGDLLAGVVEAGAAGFVPKHITLRLAMIRRVLGIDLPTEQVLDALSRLRLSPVLAGDAIKVTVPSDRLDLNIEVDLVEEVARVVGYERIPVREEISIRLTQPQPGRKTLSDLRLLLVGVGYFEAVTISLQGGLAIEEFRPPEAAEQVKVAAEHAKSKLRMSMLPLLLISAGNNEAIAGIAGRFFETGSVYWRDAGGKIQERQRLGLVGSADFHEVRGVVESLLRKLDAHKPIRFVPEERQGMARGASALVDWDGHPVGYIGKISRRAAELCGTRELRVAAELDLAALLAGAQLLPQLQPLPRFPAVERDLSLVLKEPVRYEAVEALVRDIAPQWLESLEYVTTYRGKPLEKGVKSVTVKLVFRSATQTLTSEQAEESVAKVVEAAAARLGAALRT